MSIELSGETENRIREAVRSGHFATASDLIELAVRRFLEQSPSGEGRFRKLRRRIEESGVAMLGDEELRSEIRSRRGSLA